MRRQPQIVVIVEDDPAVLASLTFAFEVEGFSVRAHASAEALLAEGPPPARACLVVDYRLPGVDGLELLRILREQGRGRSALLIATSDANLHRRAAAADVEIIEKPLLSDVLIEKVRGRLSAR
jgi:two-component system, LuxR family, response regulator FixJ